MNRIMVNIALSALVAVLGFAAVANANSLKGIDVAGDGDSITVTISTSSSCEYNAFITENKPERIVIDLTGVENNLKQKHFEKLPLRSIHSIRTSQFKATPDLQARVVLDIERPIEFKSYRNGNEIVVRFAAMAEETDFADWSYPAKAKPAQPVPQPKKEVEVAKTKPVVTPPENKTPVEVASVEPKSSEIEIKEETVESEVEEVESEAILPPKLEVKNPSGMQGVQVDTTPKRKVVEYASLGLKDPFAPLVGAGSARIREGLPSLENLKLVGILEDVRMNRALLEDAEGNGYILKPNDRIKGGHLVSVSNNKAIFQVTEYGWTRTVALELSFPEIR